MAIGFDCGTYNLICCSREKNNLKLKHEINAFLEIPLNDRFVFNMMKKSGIPLIERNNVAYALGEAAVRMAYTMSDLSLKRPMKDGCVNPQEKDAFQILNIMIHSLLDEVQQDGETLYYSVPSNALNQETDADYHQKILESIFKSYKSDDGFSVNASPINEALAIIYSELGNSAYTGIGVSCGSGQVNVCYAVFGNPIFQFSLVNSGDWIDKMSAKATGENVTFINQEKHKIDLAKEPVNLIERAIQTQYKIMIDHTVSGIKKGLIGANQKVKTSNPIDIVVAGGTSSPNGFIELFRDAVDKSEMPIEIKSVIRPDEPVYCVAKGCLIAAENATNF